MTEPGTKRSVREGIPSGAGHGAVVAGLLAVYLLLSLNHLGSVPPVYEDEPWQASTGWKLATEGVFGSDLFAGYFGMERHYYGFMPLHPLLLAATFKLAGLGLVQARMETVALGGMALLLTYALGRRLFDRKIALLALALLLLVRLTGTTRYLLTGIPFLDLSRIARYDMVVLVLGLAALHLLLSAREHDHPGLYLLAGIASALAGLGHVYGVFWILVLFAYSIWDGAGLYRIGLLALGFCLPWAGYGIYVWGNLPDWIGQTQGYASRFQLTNLSWYWANAASEPQRYGPGLGPLGPGYLLRPGFWVAAMVLPGSLAVLTWRALRLGDRKARAIAIPLLVFPILFALLLTLKLVNYTLTFLPIAALAAAWGSRSLWTLSRSVWHGAALRLALILVSAAIVLEGISRLIILQTAAAQTTAYGDFIERVRREIPPGSTVLGLHNYWLGLHEFEYRSWPMPLLLGSTAGGDPTSIVIEALTQMDPDVILIDDRMREYFDLHLPDDPVARAAFGWVEGRHFVLLGAVDDRTYGRMEIYGRP
ncbi:MAG TPA: glycosyltransferase family 39 protein [Candidatus Methylomirabilis sp.]